LQLWKKSYNLDYWIKLYLYEVVYPCTVLFTWFTKHHCK